VAAGKRLDHADARRADFNSPPVEFDRGHRGTIGLEPVDDRGLASNAGDNGAKACYQSGGIGSIEFLSRFLTCCPLSIKPLFGSQEVL
jgi:hypothetical protein